MSVILFGAMELGRVARVIATHETRYQGATRTECAKALAKACAKLATISQANAACFAYRYGETARAVTADEIELAAINAADATLTGALSTVGLLHYNCQEERDFLAETEGGFAALVSIQGALIFAAQDRLEERALMSWYLIGEPGSQFGPCVKCVHVDCKASRDTAESACVYCGKPIGYETKVTGAFPGETGVVHFVCALGKAIR